MEKVLRSLIHERFPLELRVEIDLMSRRRDISNEEKQEEIMGLLLKYNIDDYVRLGPGTNRYAFKLDGFVVKVATDHDGKIDNLKEFKMAKRLFPYVANTYEVSENGTLLVAEYVPPFETFQEMCMYSDQIEDILRKLSYMYLIGDVGIASKNYSNWGIRVGTNDPVCLDFAYVYEVSSKLFVCRHCKSNSILVPYDHFNNLICPNPNCNHTYKFEDIRARIGNELHRHEIGDLSGEGYRLTESGVMTTLTEDRSNYLVQERNNDKKGKKKKKKIHEASEVVSTTPTEEEVNMNDFSKDFSGVPFAPAPIVITGVSTPAKESDKFVAIVGESVPAEDTDTGKVEYGTVAFSCNLKPDVVEIDGESSIIIEGTSEGVSDTPAEEVIPPAPPVTEVVVEPEAPAIEGVTIEVNIDPEDTELPESFKMDIHDALSWLANSAERYMQKIDLLHTVRDHISSKKKVFGDDDFYRPCQNTFFRSIAAFLEMVEDRIPRPDRPEYPKKVYVLSKIPTPDSPFYPTVVFLYRCWKHNLIKSNEDLEKVMIRYSEKFSDFMGVQKQWQTIFKNRIKNKLPIDNVGAQTIGDILSDLICPKDDPKPSSTKEPEVTSKSEPHKDWDKCVAAVLADMHKKYDGPGEFNMNDARNVLVYCAGCAGHVYTIYMNMETMVLFATDNGDTIAHVQYANLDAAANGLADDIDNMYTTIENAINSNDKEGSSNDGEMFGSFDINEDLGDSEYNEDDEDEDEDEDGEDDEDGPVVMRVDITRGEHFDYIRVNYADSEGPVAIPIYTSMSDVDLNEEHHSMIDDRNGSWDWLVNFEPNLAFTTKDPDKWINVGKISATEIGLAIVIIDVGDNDVYTMGVYPVDGIYLIDDDEDSHELDDPGTLERINRIVSNAIGYNETSFIKWHDTNGNITVSEDEMCEFTGITDPDENNEGDENNMDHGMDPSMMTAASVLVGEKRVQEYVESSSTPLVPPQVTVAPPAQHEPAVEETVDEVIEMGVSEPQQEEVTPEPEPEPIPEPEKVERAPSTPITVSVKPPEKDKKDPNTFFKPIRKKQRDR